MNHDCGRKSPTPDTLSYGSVEQNPRSHVISVPADWLVDSIGDFLEGRVLGEISRSQVVNSYGDDNSLIPRFFFGVFPFLNGSQYDDQVQNCSFRIIQKVPYK